MSYAGVWTAANAPDFQGRCLAGLWDVSVKVLGGNPSKDDAAYSNIVLRGEQEITPAVLAMQVLRNTTIAADPDASTDADIEWQLNAVWKELISIG